MLPFFFLQSEGLVDVEMIEIVGNPSEGYTIKFGFFYMELWRTHIHLLTTSGEDVEVEQPGVSAQGRWRGGGTGQFFYKKNILKNDVNTFNIYIFFQLLLHHFLF